MPGDLAARLEVGSLVRVPLGARRVRGVVCELGDEPAEEGLQDVAALIVEPPVAPRPLDDLLAWVARRYAAPLGAAFERSVPPRVRVKAPAPGVLAAGPAPCLLPAYRGGGDLIRAIAGGGRGAYSLRAVPGEDHGALLCELAGAALGCSRGAVLVAVPEVRFGSPVLDTLSDLWPEAARVDSSQSEPDRARAWLQLASGHRLGLGGRAAVLAPAPELRLIVLDEEEHPAYKEDRSPRYDARRVALARAELQGAVCVLVSSTPSVDLYGPGVKAITGAVVPEPAASRAARPVVETVEPPPDRALSRLLHQRIRDTLRTGERVAVLAPMRGYAPTVWCSSCQRSLRCPRCERSLFAARSSDLVRCGLCGFKAPTPAACPHCTAAALRFMGAGSERLADQVSKSFPRARVVRMDPDILQADGDEAAGAPDRPVDIYVTTWIGTKPSLRPEVSLVGVLDADALLRRPDWRATERAYQALVAMSEWAGPAARGGRLVIQTAEPFHYAVQAVIRADHDFFVERELAQREELGYPPYSELIAVAAYGPRRAGLIERAAATARPAGRVLGPAPVTRRGARGPEEGLEILVKCPHAEEVAAGLRDILGSVPAGNRLRVDVDPR